MGDGGGGRFDSDDDEHSLMTQRPLTLFFVEALLRDERVNLAARWAPRIMARTLFSSAVAAADTGNALFAEWMTDIMMMATTTTTWKPRITAVLPRHSDSVIEHGVLSLFALRPERDPGQCVATHLTCPVSSLSRTTLKLLEHCIQQATITEHHNVADRMRTITIALDWQHMTPEHWTIFGQARAQFVHHLLATMLCVPLISAFVCPTFKTVALQDTLMVTVRYAMVATHAVARVLCEFPLTRSSSSPSSSPMWCQRLYVALTRINWDLEPYQSFTNAVQACCQCAPSAHCRTCSALLSCVAHVAEGYQGGRRPSQETIALLTQMFM